MKVTQKVSERASTTIPHDVFARFLRSLGAEVPDGVKLHVHQSGGSYSGPPPDIHVGWDLSEEETEREVAMIDDEDVELIAGLQDTDPAF